MAKNDTRQSIYRDYGMKVIPYRREFRDRIAQRNSVSERLVDMVVHRMIKNGFLDQTKYDAHHVVAIPSVNIAVNEDNAGNTLPYYFINPSKDSVSSEETRNNSEETPIYSEKIPNNNGLLRNNSEISRINTEKRVNYIL